MKKYKKLNTNKVKHMTGMARMFILFVRHIGREIIRRLKQGQTTLIYNNGNIIRVRKFGE